MLTTHVCDASYDTAKHEAVPNKSKSDGNQTHRVPFKGIWFFGVTRNSYSDVEPTLMTPVGFVS